MDIGITIEIIIQNWTNFTYPPWHVDRMSWPRDVIEEDDYTNEEEINTDDNDMDEWQMSSHIIHPNSFQVSFLETLGRRDFDLNVV